MIYSAMNIINAMDTKAAGAWLEKMYLEWQLDQGAAAHLSPGDRPGAR